MSELKEDFVLVQDPGDPSVGIQPSTFETKGPLFFTDQEEKEDFRKALQEAFEYVTDQPHVVFQTEYDAECQAEEQFEREMDETQEEFMKATEDYEQLLNNQLP